MFKFPLHIAALLSLMSFNAYAANWQVDPAASTLGFKGSNGGEAFSGVFKKFDATISYDANDLATAKFDVVVDVTSEDTQDSERDKTLAGADFFAFDKFPKAHFVTDSFAKTADGVEAKGTLTIRDKTQPVTLKVTFTPSESGATLDVDTTLQRLDFDLGVGDDEWKKISKDIPVHGHVVLTAKP